jgi:hypothetical protein
VKRAWTEGPWVVRDGTPEGGGQVWEIVSPHAPDVNCNEVASSWENRPTADLIALAPEMAVAILAMQIVNDRGAGLWVDDPLRDKIDDLAEKLRQIGGE